jgi:Complex 1 protein (LYR family)
MAPGTRRLSGLQKTVFGLYRSILREAVKKDRQQQQHQQGAAAVVPTFPSLLCQANGKATTAGYARSEFRTQAQQVKRTDFKKIEYMIRKGEKQLKILKMPGTKVVMGAS